MHPIGIALAFLVFWSLAAAGLFIARTAAGRLRYVAVRREISGALVHLTVANGVAITLHLTALLAGSAMVVAGF